MPNTAFTSPKFGSDVPFAEPQWYSGLPTVYYNESHVELRNRLRKFVDTELLPFVNDWEEDYITTGKEVDSKALAKKAVEYGVLAPMIAAKFGGTPLPNNVPFDSFHDLIWIDEISRTGASGLIAGLTIWTMALPPVLNYGNDFHLQTVAKPVLRGEKLIALCISEPYGGSDVANLRTTAEMDESGENYIVNGQKKWITMGFSADYFTTAVRTGGPNSGPKGVSILIIPRNTPGITVKRMKLQGNWLAGTSLVTFDNVVVPKKFLLHKENEGLKLVLANFSHERFVIAVQAIRQCRICIEEAVNFARSRKTFNQTLINFQVIRHKIAEMARQTEACFSMAESLAFQMEEQKKQAKGQVVGSNMFSANISLLKVNASKTLEYCCREASQIIGGGSYTREGKGQVVERIYREVRSYAIPGGSEEIMLDYAMKAAKI